MPARRQPFVYLWAGATTHPKIATLSNGVFRTWVELLVAGSQQRRQWCFASVKHAALVARRPKSHIYKLIDARLLDVIDGGLYIHDAHRWQNVPHPVRAEWNALRAQLSPSLYGDTNVCPECGSADDLTIDHIVPIARGGSNDLENLAVLCRPCNSRKGTR